MYVYILYTTTPSTIRRFIQPRTTLIDHDALDLTLRILLLLCLLSLQKLIKELPSLVPSDDAKIARITGAIAVQPCEDSNARADSPCSLDSTASQAGLRQQHGDKTAEKVRQEEKQQRKQRASPAPGINQKKKTIGKSPGEIAFFKLLHSEFKKATHFFERASEEFIIREERVSEGMGIMKQPNSIMVNEKWSLMAKSIFRLYKDLLLLETFAIMAYCSFSKILKKHDKVTGYDTRNAFMLNIVNKANFTNYPKVLEMINRCERLYGEVSENLLREGKEGLYEDERLFINMIHRLNEQVLGSEYSEHHTERKEAPRRIVAKMPASEKESQATSTLRTLVEENDKKKERPAQADPAHVSAADGDDDDSDDDCPAADTKRQAISSPTQSPAKRQRSDL
jgi:hypothetical protein